MSVNIEEDDDDVDVGAFRIDTGCLRSPRSDRDLSVDVDDESLKLLGRSMLDDEVDVDTDGTDVLDRGYLELDEESVNIASCCGRNGVVDVAMGTAPGGCHGGPVSLSSDIPMDDDGTFGRLPGSMYSSLAVDIDEIGVAS